MFDCFGISNDVIRHFGLLYGAARAADGYNRRFLGLGVKVGCGGYGKCPREIIRFLDLHTGLLLTGPQLEMAYNWSWLKGGRVLDMDTFDEDHEFVLRNYTDFDLSELAGID